MQSELKPCKCGEVENLVVRGSGMFVAKCLWCGRSATEEKSKNDAIAAWNRRAPEGEGK